MAKRRSVEEFRLQYKVLSERGKLREFEQFLDAYEVPSEVRQQLVEQFKRDAANALRQSRL